jgi:hypothetical protein
MPSKMYFRCGGGISINRHQTRGMRGCGAGAVLLNRGGPGGASSYDSPLQYAETTGRGMGRGVSGLGGMRELADLKIHRGSGMKKPKNINFSL